MNIWLVRISSDAQFIWAFWISFLMLYANTRSNQILQVLSILTFKRVEDQDKSLSRGLAYRSNHSTGLYNTIVTVRL